MVHKPKHKVHSFRGSLADTGQDEINLERQNVNLAYRVVKFQLMALAPGTVTGEITSKIYKESQTLVTGTVDFSDPDLLGAATIKFQTSVANPETPTAVIFDNELFSRNIYVTTFDTDASNGINYYLEIEEVPVGAATLMQIKLGSARKLIGGSMGK